MQKQHAAEAVRAGWSGTAVVALAMLAVLKLGGMAQAGTLYWDSDGSTVGNNASTGTNRGGSGI